MTLSEWRDRLALMARSSICHLEPHEAADLVKAIGERGENRKHDHPRETYEQEASRWAEMVSFVKDNAPRHGHSLEKGVLIRLEKDHAVLRFRPQDAFHKTTVFGLSRGDIEKMLTLRANRPFWVELEGHEVDPMTGRSPESDDE